MNQIKIAIDATILKPQMAGLNRYTIEILNQLSNQLDSNYNFEPEIFTHDINIKDIWNKKINIISGVNPSLKYYIFKRFFWHLNILPIILKIKRFNIFYSSVPEGILIPTAKQVITIHDLLPVKYPEIYPRMRFYFRHILPVLIKASSAIITISEATKNDIIDFYRIKNKPIYVIPCGINKNIFYPVNELQIEIINRKYNLSNYILFVSEIRPYKNLFRLIKAFGNLHISNIDLVIVGALSKFGKDDILALPHKLGIENRVKFLGYIQDNDLPAVYSGASMLVFPSLTEGFGIPPLEAMSCGCPVITSNTSSMPEVCGDAALYIDPYNIDSITNAINLLINNDQLRQKFIIKGFQRSKIFSWEKTASEILKVIELVANQ